MKVYMFPGQGSQHRGMGEKLFERFTREVEEASHLLGEDIKDLCLYDTMGKLNQTQFTQPCLYLVNCLSYLALREDKGELPDYLCGHSLGEYSALFAADVFDLYAGFEIVKKRGELMADIREGGLVAILGNDVDQAMMLLKEEDLSRIDLANFNTPEQIVIGGVKKDLDLATALLEKKGFRCVQLNVSGAFHTHYMESARHKFMKFLTNYTFKEPTIPVLCSSFSHLFKEKYAIETLGFQITRSVNWVECIQKLGTLGAKTFTEVGPGEVLTRMTDKIISYDA